MTTLATHRPQVPPARRGAAAPAGPPGFVPIAPVKLMRQDAPWLAAALVAGAVLGAGAHFVLREVRPSYTSAALFQCMPPRYDLLETAPASIGRDEFQRFIGT